MQRCGPGLGAFCLGAAITILAGCATHGGSGGLLPAAPADSTSLGQVANAPAGVGRDLGRRAPRKVVFGLVALRYRHEAELRRLVDELADPASPRYRRFLAQQAFDARFAPSAQDQARVIAALRAGGFTIVRTFPGRATIDVSAPAATAEAYFRTRIHDFDQGRYGTRFANVAPLRVPPAIAPLVRAVELNSMVYARTAATPAQPDTATRDRIRNGDFEQRLEHWHACSPSGWASRVRVFAGKFSALVGTNPKAPSPTHGLRAICQSVRIPNDGVLTAHTFSVANVKQSARNYQEIGLMSASGKVEVVLRKDVVNRPRWKNERWNVGKYAGRRMYAFFGVFTDGRKKTRDSMYVDDVTLIGTIPSPSPSPSVSPSMSPSPTPTSSPTSPPTPVGPGPGQPLTGPRFGPSGGWAPRSIADGFDFPVQHGYDGRGSTAAIVMQGAVNLTDLAQFLSANQTVRTGKFTVQKVNGGPRGGDVTEGTIDVETVESLAPGADVIAYEAPDLSNQSILNAYQTALNDKTVAVVDSTFTECDSVDPAFDDASEADAIAGAAMGMTFVGASGDTGSACYDGSGHGLGPAAPGSDPHFLGVGGNQSTSPAFGSGSCACPIDSSVAWDDHNLQWGGLSGGGVSAHWPLPDYQLGVAGRPASQTKRNVPDIAFPAVDGDLRYAGRNEAIDGTSWSASIATALVAQSIAICGRLGYANPALYAAYASHGEGSIFADVTSGSNKGYTARFPGYSASRGYDNVTGIGMPKGFAFALALCGRQAAR
jgi:hypothetical protein